MPLKNLPLLLTQRTIPLSFVHLLRGIRVAVAGNAEPRRHRNIWRDKVQGQNENGEPIGMIIGPLPAIMEGAEVRLAIQMSAEESNEEDKRPTISIFS